MQSTVKLHSICHRFRENFPKNLFGSRRDLEYQKHFLEQMQDKEHHNLCLEIGLQSYCDLKIQLATGEEDENDLRTSGTN